METKVNSATGLKVKVSKAAVACPPTKSSLRAARSGGIIVGKRTGAALAVTAVDRALILVVVTMTRRDVTRHALCNVERAPTQRDGPNSPRKKRKPNWDCNATTYQRCRDSPITAFKLHETLTTFRGYSTDLYWLQNSPTLWYNAEISFATLPRSNHSAIDIWLEPNEGRCNEYRLTCCTMQSTCLLSVKKFCSFHLNTGKRFA